MTYNTKIRREQGGNRIVVPSGGELRIQSGGSLIADSGSTLSGVGGSFPSLSWLTGIAEAASVLNGNSKLFQLTLTNVLMNVTDRTTAGAQGTLTLVTLPQGYWLSKRWRAAGITTTKGAGGISAGTNLQIGIGTATVGTGDANLTTTEQDLLNQVNVSQSSGTGTWTTSALTAPIPLGSLSATTDIFLNLTVQDAGSSADDTVTFNGTLECWLEYGGDL